MTEEVTATVNATASTPHLRHARPGLVAAGGRGSKAADTGGLARRAAPCRAGSMALFSHSGPTRCQPGSKRSDARRLWSRLLRMRRWAGAGSGDAGLEQAPVHATLGWPEARCAPAPHSLGISESRQRSPHALSGRVPGAASSSCALQGKEQSQRHVALIHTPVRIPRALHPSVSLPSCPTHPLPLATSPARVEPTSRTP